MEERVTRRELLAKGIVVATGAAAAAMLPQQANAADGDSLVIGQGNTGGARTQLSAAVASDGVLNIENTYSSGPCQAVRATGYAGVEGASKSARADGPVPPPAGVVGHYFAPATGALGVGVIGSVLNHDGSDGDPRGVGVLGTSGIYDSAWSEEQKMGSGVVGEGSSAGVRAASPSGRALDVKGKAHFSRSGRASIGSGKTYKDVTCSSLATSSMILATLQGSGGSGVAVAHCARLSSTKFRVTLTKAAARSVNFAWFVID